MEAVIVYCTCPSADVAGRLARALVEERLAACVTCLPGAVSTYRWNDAVTVEQEVLLMIKTSTTRHAALQARLVALHPNEVPEVLAVSAHGFAPYLSWINRETRPA